jgi:membrane-bound lytic murein transglycosylase D
MKKTLFLTLMGFFLFLPFSVLLGQIKQPVDTASKEFDFIKDDFIAASLDSLANLKYFEGYECASDKEIENVFGFTHGFVPVYSDSVYYERLRKLDASTPIKLTYNQYVRDYIELYAVKKRALTERVMGLAQIYFPMFEEQLDKFDMPLELKYLAIVESALNPEARSRVGATGLWQFMYGTGKMYNLNVSSFVDDRRDPIRSTIAACEHMSDLYKMYKDWLLVLAAYNSGAGNVNKAIRRSGGKMDFWQIRPFLPLETRGYVPAFIGVTYVMTYAAEHNLRPVQPRIYHYEIDTVTVNDLLTFNQISENIKVPIEDLQFLNPSYKSGVIPAVSGKSYTLRLPKQYIPAYVNNEARLYALGAQKKDQQEQLLSMMKTVTGAEYHKVRRGENLGLISNKYHCTVSDLKRWNKLKSTTLAVGQRLIVRPERAIEQQYAAIPKKEQKAPVKETASKETVALIDTSLKQSTVNNNEEVLAEAGTENNEVKTENIVHKVKPGETLNKIAQSNNVTVTDIKGWNRLTTTVIHPGDELIVGKHDIQVAPKEVMAENKTPDNKKKNNQFIYYTVQRGDTLWTIAQKHEGCSVEEIKKLNNIRNERSLKPGQKIKVAIAS